MANHTEILQKLLVYRNILADNFLREFVCRQFKQDEFPYDLAYELIKKAEDLGFEGNLLHNYILYLISRDENAFSITAEKYGGVIGSSLAKAVLRDITVIKQFFQQHNDPFFSSDLITSYVPTNNSLYNDLRCLKTVFFDAEKQHTPEQVMNELIQHYISHGYGTIAGHAFLRWDENQHLVGIKHYDTVTFEDIVGYERQKHILIKNAEAFLAGKPYHNVLLVGARGTGKSSSVKALINEYYCKGLRLVEIPKRSLSDLTKVMNTLEHYGKKFVLFLDDLSFEETEVEYKCLKSALEGGVGLIPENIMICATSNRRHLVRETWQDRAGNPDDVHRLDSVHEKISLSDRFGITLTYQAPNQEEYMRIVEELAKKHAVPISPSELKSQAVRWEMSHSGRSGRTARQLITHLLSSK
ncbi:MAG: ATP-binding protein [Bacillota bacterium]